MLFNVMDFRLTMFFFLIISLKIEIRHHGLDLILWSILIDLEQIILPLNRSHCLFVCYYTALYCLN